MNHDHAAFFALAAIVVCAHGYDVIRRTLKDRRRAKVVEALPRGGVKFGDLWAPMRPLTLDAIATVIDLEPVHAYTILRFAAMVVRTSNKDLSQERAMRTLSSCIDDTQAEFSGKLSNL